MLANERINVSSLLKGEGPLFSITVDLQAHKCVHVHNLEVDFLLDPANHFVHPG